MASDAAERTQIGGTGFTRAAEAIGGQGSAVVAPLKAPTAPDPVIDLRGDAPVIDLVPRTKSGVIPRNDLPEIEVKLKRAFDIAFALGALGVAGLPMLVVAGAVRLASPGPSMFCQTRVGKDGEHFVCLKFRSMRGDAGEILQAMLDADPVLAAEFEAGYKLRNDPRITGFGGLLRKTSIDELPQLINVLRGDMSVVGPRPLQPDETIRYGEAIDQVLSVRPGMTGLWQVSGRNDLGYEERIEIDTKYASTWRVLDDIKILLRTVPALAFPGRNGAY